MKLVKINEVKPNPSNPRVIKDHKFAQLKKSLEDFPDMANVRPIVVNKDMVVLGGNMRLKAMKDAGWKQVPVEVVDWPEDKQREFIIKDNVGFGEWDWQLIGTDWPEAEEWGLDVPNWSAGLDVNEMGDDDVDLTENFDPIGKAANLTKITFIFDNEIQAKEFYEKHNLNYEYKVMNGGTGGDSKVWQINLSTVYGS